MSIFKMAAVFRHVGRSIPRNWTRFQLRNQSNLFKQGSNTTYNALVFGGAAVGVVVAATVSLVCRVDSLVMM